MMMRMLSIQVKTAWFAAVQSRIMRRARRSTQAGLRPTGQGYAISDSMVFKADGPSGRYQIFVAVPPAPPPPSGYPVLYLLDGNAIFGTAVDAARLQMPWPDISAVTPFMIVGVGYPGKAPFDHARRSWDLAPPLRDPTWRSPLGLPWHQPGGADPFIDFLTGDLLRALADRFPLDTTKRGVAGLSLGGTFALYALATRPGAFTFHAAISAAVWFDNERVLTDLQTLKAGSLDQLDLFLALGGRELGDDQAIATMMITGSKGAAREAERAGARVNHLVLPDENHQSAFSAAMPAAMRLASHSFQNCNVRFRENVAQS